MPDSRVRVYKGDFPDRHITDKMKLGEKFLWVPKADLRRIGCTPTLYVVEQYTHPRGSKSTLMMPYTPLHPAVRG